MHASYTELVQLATLTRLGRGPHRGPHLLEAVEAANLRAEDMDDDVARIDQDPVAVRQAFDVNALHAGFAEFLHHILRDRADMPVGPAGRDDHVVCDGGFAAKVDGECVLRLHVVEAGEDDLQGLVGIRPGFRDRGGRGLFAGPCDC